MTFDKKGIESLPKHCRRVICPTKRRYFLNLSTMIQTCCHQKGQTAGTFCSQEDFVTFSLSWVRHMFPARDSFDKNQVLHLDGQKASMTIDVYLRQWSTLEGRVDPSKAPVRRFFYAQNRLLSPCFVYLLVVTDWYNCDYTRSSPSLDNSVSNQKG